MTTAIARTADQLRVIEDVSITLCVDESGSMHRVDAATLASVNSYIQSLHAGASVTLSIAPFGESVRWPVVGLPSDTVDPLTTADYHPAGKTALYDAVHQAIEKIDNMPIPPAHPVIVVFTDGRDTCSKIDAATLKPMVVYRRDELNWRFVAFVIGAHAAEATEAAGFLPEDTASYSADDSSTQLAFQRLAKSTIRLAEAVKMHALPPAKFLD